MAVASSAMRLARTCGRGRRVDPPSLVLTLLRLEAAGQAGPKLEKAPPPESRVLAAQTAWLQCLTTDTKQLPSPTVLHHPCPSARQLTPTNTPRGKRNPPIDEPLHSSACGHRITHQTLTALDHLSSPTASSVPALLSGTVVWSEHSSLSPCLAAPPIATQP